MICCGNQIMIHCNHKSANGLLYRPNSMSIAVNYNYANITLYLREHPYHARRAARGQPTFVNTPMLAVQPAANRKRMFPVIQ